MTPTQRIERQRRRYRRILEGLRQMDRRSRDAAMAMRRLATEVEGVATNLHALVRMTREWYPVKVAGGDVVAALQTVVQLTRDYGDKLASLAEEYSRDNADDLAKLVSPNPEE